MTTERLHDLLHERVADLPLTDAELVDEAWSRASQVRRRRASGAVLGSVTAVALVVGGVWWSGRPDSSPNQLQGPTGGPTTATTSSPSPTEATGSGSFAEPSPVRPDAMVDGHPAWVAPPLSAQDSLPAYAVASGERSALPPVIDLSQEATRGQAVVDSAVAVWGIGDDDVPLRRVVVLDNLGVTFELDVSRLDAVADEGGNERTPLGALRADGQKVFFIQRDSVEIYDFGQGLWSSIPTASFLAEGARWVGDDLWVPDKLGGTTGTRWTTGGTRVGRFTLDPDEQPWAGLDSMPGGAPVTGPGAGQSAGFYSVPTLDEPIQGWASTEVIAARSGGDLSMLVFSYADDPPRSKLCCSMAGWLSENWVAFGSEGDVLAWRPGSGDVALVTRLTGLQAGEHAVPTYASLLR